MKNKNIKYYLIVFTILYVFLNFGCNLTKDLDFTGIKVTHTFPKWDSNFNILGYDTIKEYRYYKKNKEIISFSYDWVVQKNNFVLTEKNCFFAFFSNENFGYLFDTFQDKNGQKLSKDSLLKTKISIEKKTQNTLKKYSTFISQVYDKNSNCLRLKFNLKGGLGEAPYDTSGVGSCEIFYYKKLLNSDKGIFTDFDTIPNMKLCKFIARYKPIYSKDANKFFENQVIYIEIDEYTPDNKTKIQILDYFSKLDSLSYQNNK